MPDRVLPEPLFPGEQSGNGAARNGNCERFKVKTMALRASLRRCPAGSSVSFARLLASNLRPTEVDG